MAAILSRPQCVRETYSKDTSTRSECSHVTQSCLFPGFACNAFYSSDVCEFNDTFHILCKWIPRIEVVTTKDTAYLAVDSSSIFIRSPTFCGKASLNNSRFPSHRLYFPHISQPHITSRITRTLKMMLLFNTLRSRQNGRHFSDDIFKCIFLNEMCEFCLRFHWSLFLRFLLTIFQHWFR